MPPSPPSYESFRVEVLVRAGFSDARGNAARAELEQYGARGVGAVQSVRGFSLALPGGRAAAERIAAAVLADAVTDVFAVLGEGELLPLPAGFSRRIDVVKKAGVMDPAAEGVLRAVRAAGEDILAARTYSAFLVAGEPGAEALRQAGARALGNEAIEEISVGAGRPVEPLAQSAPARFLRVVVDLPESDERLLAISAAGGLSLSLEEMRAIRAHFRAAARSPTDLELETIAQTWSEHCKHKTLTGAVEIDGRRYENLLQETIFAATRALDRPWCVSVFSDNAGVVAFDEDFHVTFKVETHNHPSAIEPYGGAGTGIGGVLRDTMGTGLGAKPIVSTDVFCVGPPDLAQDQVPPGALSPLRVLKGVVAGVRDYGNRMGIPTANGAVLFDRRYTGNPLVFCGSVGLLPAGKVEKNARPGDLVVVAGGRTGRDGIHGATFSSRELHSASETLDSGAVQIGNAIAEKRLLDALLQARDRGLYTCITDCGAGGLSSAVGEMAAACGADVDVEKVPLKYAGLSYAEIWISEAQERMVFAVPPEHEAELLELFSSEDVEATVIGRFTASGRLVVRCGGAPVGDLDLDFLHQGVPRVARRAALPAAREDEPDLPSPESLGGALLQLLSAPNIASKEWIVRQYDHEVLAGTVVKPFAGREQLAPADAAVIKPRLDSSRGIAIGCGINPAYGDVDPYEMGLLAVDEAVRNVVAAGGRADRVALLDNFCAGSCERPEILGAVARVAEACRDAALALGAPFISGKDSLNNEYRCAEGSAAIPTTLLVSALAHVDDVRRAVTTDLKRAGSALLLVGVTRAELGGSAWYALHGRIGRSVPQVDLERARETFAAITGLQNGRLALACHDLAEGGLGVALAEMAFGTGLGAEVDLALVPRASGAGGLLSVERDDRILFSESPTRFLLEVAPERLAGARELLAGLPHAVIGQTSAAPRLAIRGLERALVLDEPIASLQRAFAAPLDFGSPAARPAAGGPR
ncbi:MAG: phosphoribosylformylglycinamidine synthase subunit PurL [Planctomycetes bacterium]|nr:phosphoribosylformylglycinamidine synthase subunit PurL [Planctomycetota bacterium]